LNREPFNKEVFLFTNHRTVNTIFQPVASISSNRSMQLFPFLYFFAYKILLAIEGFSGLVIKKDKFPFGS